MSLRNTYSRFILLALHLLVAPLIAISSDNITYKNAQQLTQSISKFRAHTALTQNLLNSCAVQFPKLKQEALSILNEWQDRNSASIQRSTTLHSLLVNSIREHESAQAAEKYQLELDTLIFNNSKKMQDTLLNYNDSEREQVCKQLILTVDSKLWDLQYKFPIEYNYLVTHSF